MLGKKQYVVRRSEVKVWKMAHEWYVIFYKYMSKIVYDSSLLIICLILYWNANCLISYFAKIIFRTRQISDKFEELMDNEKLSFP